jgi:hypothetical protein
MVQAVYGDYITRVIWEQAVVFLPTVVAFWAPGSNRLEAVRALELTHAGNLLVPSSVTTRVLVNMHVMLS